jgi:Na+/H+ antiporter NhaC
MKSIRQKLESKVLGSIKKLQLLSRFEIIFGFFCFLLGAIILLLAGTLSISKDNLWFYIVVLYLVGFISLLTGYDIKKTVKNFDTQNKAQLAVDGKIESLLLAPILIVLVPGTVSVMMSFEYPLIIILVLFCLTLFIIFLRDLIKLKTLTYKYNSELRKIKKDEKRQEKLLKQNTDQIDSNRKLFIKSLLNFLVIIIVIGVAITGIIFIGPLWIIAILLALMVFRRN